MTAVYRSTAVLALVLCAASLAGAQQRPERFRVDPLTSTISGRVTSDTGGPLRHAEVRAISESGLTRFATTDAEGHYLVRDLPAGTFTLHVSKTGFVPLYFGQNRPFEQRTTIRLAQGQRFAADVRLPRAGVITGRVYDRAGEPVLGARVQALRRRVIDGKPGLQVTGTADTTDDTGSYRLYGLPPGDYYVAATPRQIEDRSGRRLTPAAPGRGAPIFYPGTANRDEALRITVATSGEARADLQLLEVRTSRVSGTVVTAAGAPAAGAMITLLSRDLDVGVSGPGGNAMIPLQVQADAAADGTFELTGVPPGSFLLRVQTRLPLPQVFANTSELAAGRVNMRAMESALVPVVVDGDITGLSVTTARGGTVEVVVAADEDVTAPLPARVGVSLRTADLERTESMMMDVNRPSEAKLILELAAPSRLSVEGLPDSWALKSVMLDADDVTDKILDLKNRASATLRVVLTDRITQLSGSITSSSPGAAASVVPSTVIVFADDEAKWTHPSRFIRTARVSGQGTFQVNGLPANADYRAIAVDYVEEGEETDPEFLKRMRERGTRFSLREGERRMVELRVINR